MQKLRPQEVDVLTYPNGAHMNFGASSPRVSAITEISFANGYKNSASSNSYEVIHGRELTQKHS
jgi:hypothetical protein